MGRNSDAKERVAKGVLDLIWQGSFMGTTVDQICERAGVNKGSFYYFFRSKSDAAAFAIESGWMERKPQMDSLFDSSIAPLERLTQFCRLAYEGQRELKKEHGVVMGCPLFTLGAEVCHCGEQGLADKIRQILSCHTHYIEQAIRDAARLGVIHSPRPAQTARLVVAYCHGVMMQARILNDLRPLKAMAEGVLQILHAPSAQQK